MARSFNLLRTIRGHIFLGFVAMGVLTGALGGYGIYAAARANHIVTDIYDRPLMAINFARSASATFAQMENNVLRSPPSAQGRMAPAPLDELADSFFGDLRVAEERSISAAAAPDRDRHPQARPRMAVGGFRHNVRRAIRRHGQGERRGAIDFGI